MDVRQVHGDQSQCIKVMLELQDRPRGLARAEVKLRGSRNRQLAARSSARVHRRDSGRQLSRPNESNCSSTGSSALGLLHSRASSTAEEISLPATSGPVSRRSAFNRNTYRQDNSRHRGSSPGLPKGRHWCWLLLPSMRINLVQHSRGLTLSIERRHNGGAALGAQSLLRSIRIASASLSPFWYRLLARPAFSMKLARRASVLKTSTV